MWGAAHPCTTRLACPNCGSRREIVMDADQANVSDVTAKLANLHYLNQEFDAGPDDVVEITLDGQANVMLLDPANYERYRKREPFSIMADWRSTHRECTWYLLTWVSGM